MRPMPSSAVSIGSGSASDRTPMPRPARSWTRLRTSRRLRPSRSRVCTTIVSPAPGVVEHLGQAVAVDGGAGLLVGVDLGWFSGGRAVSVVNRTYCYMITSSAQTGTDAARKTVGKDVAKSAFLQRAGTVCSAVRGVTVPPRR